MLLTFRCANFASIRDEIVLSLVAVKTLKGAEQALTKTPDAALDALKLAVIYGPNASGKSNVLNALSVFSRMVSDSWRKWEPSESIPFWNPFRLDNASPKLPAKFEIDFTLGSNIYTYGFRFDELQILEEWLIDETNRPKVLFRRSAGTDDRVDIRFPNRNIAALSKGGPSLEVLAQQTRPNSLFLSAAAQGNHIFLSDIAGWITSRFKRIDQSAGRKMKTATMCATEARKDQILELLKFADLGILDVEVAEEEAPEEMHKFFAAISKAMKETSPETPFTFPPEALGSQHAVHLVHRGEEGKGFKLEFDKESAGTRAFFVMLGPILDLLDRGGVALIDELQGVLHPLLSGRLLAIFNDGRFNPKGAQLIVATHDTTLLSSSDIRRDEVWFTEKGTSGATHLTSLVEFKPRQKQDLESAYLAGRFGATPEFDELSLLSFQKRDSTSDQFGSANYE